MNQDKKTTAFYERLKQQLMEDTSWPSPYMYKFIVPSKLEKIAEIEAVFDNMDAKINTRDSKKGTYTSISIEVTMNSAEDVIEKYLQVSKVEGVISL